MRGYNWTLANKNSGIKLAIYKRQYDTARLPKSSTRSLIGTSCQQKDIIINQNLLCCLATGCKYSTLILPIPGVFFFPMARPLLKGSCVRIPVLQKSLSPQVRRHGLMNLLRNQAYFGVCWTVTLINALKRASETHIMLAQVRIGAGLSHYNADTKKEQQWY